MTPRAPFTPYPRRYPPLDAREAEARRRRAGRVVFGCACVLVLVLLGSAIDWRGVESVLEDEFRDPIREEIENEIRQQRMEREARPATAPTGTGPYAGR